MTNPRPVPEEYRDLFEKYREELENQVRSGRITSSTKRLYLSTVRRFLNEYARQYGIREGYSKAIKNDSYFYNAKGFVDFASEVSARSEEIARLVEKLKGEIGKKADYGVLKGKVGYFRFGKDTVKGEIVKVDLKEGFFWVRDVKTERLILIPINSPYFLEVKP